MSARVLVTGAGRGLGRELVEQYLRRGDEVWATYRTKEAREELAALGAVPRLLDVGDEESVATVASEVVAQGPLDLLVNNAGTDARAFGAAPNARGPLELGGEQFIAEMRINALGPMLVTRALLPALRLAHPGRVVNISSRLGSFALGAGNSFDIGYNASKAALNMITVRTASLLSPEEVIIVAVHPGWVRTDMGGPGAPLAVEEAIGDLVATIDRLRPEQSGKFLRSDGTEHPW